MIGSFKVYITATIDKKYSHGTFLRGRSKFPPTLNLGLLSLSIIKRNTNIGRANKNNSQMLFTSDTQTNTVEL